MKEASTEHQRTRLLDMHRRGDQGLFQAQTGERVSKLRELARIPQPSTSTYSGLHGILWTQID
jgi:hypothetical protein